MILTTFMLFLSLFFVVGLSSYWASRKTTSDYLVAGKNMSPALVGLSAVATNNSGFMFIGMIGATYSMGLSSIWIMVGWIFGDWLAQKQTVKVIQEIGHQKNVHSYSGLLTHWILKNESHVDSQSATKPLASSSWAVRRFRQTVGVFTVVFLTVYAAAQLKAGSKATEVLLDWSPETGIILAAIMIFFYSMVGGLRASIWTDVAQSIVMLTGMALMVVFGVQAVGGPVEFWNSLQNVSPAYVGWFPENLGMIEAGLFVLGWIIGGMGVLGQPHIVIRFMTLSNSYTAKQMQHYYYAWFITFYSLTILAGLVSRLLMPELSSFDAELALPSLADQLMPEIFVGLILAALFAATMSTVDSLVLSCSAALSRDLTVKPVESLLLTKLATALILFAAMSLALSNNQTVFSLVLDAWGWLGSAFAPLILWLAWGRRITIGWAMIAMLFGMTVFAVFAYGGLLSQIYSITFGFIGGFSMLLISQYLSQYISQIRSKFTA
ncbi:sodium/proline symporter [Thiomicrorhabdus sp.]|uniref:sodium/proline symporter n=1 Tax=Thiomicrorhabdus sp. TaxID=2039724 RepID=UPI002AA768E9|nr:sodium/proline symporter [Thiomicrorhabdus sp.]